MDCSLPGSSVHGVLLAKILEWVAIPFSRLPSGTSGKESACQCRRPVFNLENSAVATGLETSVFIPIPKKGNVKVCSNYCTTALISQASKVMIKIPQARLQQYMNCEIPDVQAGFSKGRGNRDQIANIRWIIEKAREFQKNIYFCFIDYTKAFDCVDHNKLENA